MSIITLLFSNNLDNVKLSLIIPKEHEIMKRDYLQANCNFENDTNLEIDLFLNISIKNWYLVAHSILNPNKIFFNNMKQKQLECLYIIADYLSYEIIIEKYATFIHFNTTENIKVYTKILYLLIQYYSKKIHIDDGCLKKVIEYTQENKLYKIWLDISSYFNYKKQFMKIYCKSFGPLKTINNNNNNNNKYILCTGLSVCNYLLFGEISNLYDYFVSKEIYSNLVKQLEKAGAEKIVSEHIFNCFRITYIDRESVIIRLYPIKNPKKVIEKWPVNIMKLYFCGNYIYIHKESINAFIEKKVIVDKRFGQENCFKEYFDTKLNNNKSISKDLEIKVFELSTIYIKSGSLCSFDFEPKFNDNGYSILHKTKFKDSIPIVANIIFLVYDKLESSKYKIQINTNCFKYNTNTKLKELIEKLQKALPKLTIDFYSKREIICKIPNEIAFDITNQEYKPIIMGSYRGVLCIKENFDQEKENTIFELKDISIHNKEYIKDDEEMYECYSMLPALYSQ